MAILAKPNQVKISCIDGQYSLLKNYVQHDAVDDELNDKPEQLLELNEIDLNIDKNSNLTPASSMNKDEFSQMKTTLKSKFHK